MPLSTRKWIVQTGDNLHIHVHVNRMVSFHCMSHVYNWHFSEVHCSHEKIHSINTGISMYTVTSFISNSKLSKMDVPERTILMFLFYLNKFFCSSSEFWMFFFQWLPFIVSLHIFKHFIISSKYEEILCHCMHGKLYGIWGYACGAFKVCSFWIIW